MKLTAAALLASCLLLGQTQNQDPLLDQMNRVAQEQLAERGRAMAAIHTVADAGRRQAQVRQTLLQIIGGLPTYRGPLNPKITGQLKAEGYTIEKVLFESLPNFYVTANVYRPNHSGRFPGVFLP